MQEIQIICVNDGSPDNSLAILQEYAARDPRIDVIDKPNGGQATARNAGRAQAKGKYTYFMDADDWLELDLCEKVYQKAEETGAEVTLFFYHSYSPKKGTHNWHEKTFQSFTASTKTSVEEKIPVLALTSCWCKLFRTDFLLNNDIKFPEGLVHDDTYVTWATVTQAEKIAVVHERLYHYRHTPGSITTSISRQAGGERALNIIAIYLKIQDTLLESGNYEAYRTEFLSTKLGMWYGRHQILPVSLQPRFVKMIRDALTEDDRKFYRDSTNRQLRKLARLFYAMIDGGGIVDAVKFRVCSFLAAVRSKIQK
jgi:glycosyltransferase involved in cell wall biosynthesis